MIFRRIRGRIVPIRENKDNQRRKDVATGVLAIGAGSGVIAAGSDRGKAAQHAFRDKMYSFYKAKSDRETARYAKANKLKPYDPKTGVYDSAPVSAHFEKEMRAKYGKHVPPGVRIDFGKYFTNAYDMEKREISVSAPIETTFLHELGHARQSRHVKNPAKEKMFRFSSGADESMRRADEAAKNAAYEFRSGVAYAKKAWKQRKGTVIDPTKNPALLSAKWFQMSARSKAKSLGRRFVGQSLHVSSKVATLGNEIDAWARAFGMAKGVKLRAKIVKDSALPLGSYVLGVTRAVPKAAYIVAGASIIGYGAHRLLRRNK